MRPVWWFGVCSGIEKASFSLRDWPPDGFGCFNPFLNHCLRVGHGFFVSRAVGHAARQFGHVNNESVVILAPMDNELVFFISFFSLRRGILREPVAHELDVAAQIVELPGKGGGHFHLVDFILDAPESGDQLFPAGRARERRPAGKS